MPDKPEWMLRDEYVAAGNRLAAAREKTEPLLARLLRESGLSPEENLQLNAALAAERATEAEFLAAAEAYHGPMSDWGKLFRDQS